MRKFPSMRRDGEWIACHIDRCAINVFHLHFDNDGELQSEFNCSISVAEPRGIDDFSRQLDQLLATVERQQRRVILVVDNDLAFCREITTPPIPIQHLITALELNPGKIIPALQFPASMTAQPLAAGTTDSAVESQRMLVSGISEPLLRRCHEVARRRGIKQVVASAGFKAPAFVFRAAYPEIFQAETLGFLHVGTEYWTLEIYSGGNLCHYRTVSWSRGAQSPAEHDEGFARYTQLQSSCFDEVKDQLRASLDWLNAALQKNVSRIFVTGPFKQIKHVAKAVTLAAEVPTIVWNPAHQSDRSGLECDERHPSIQVKECIARLGCASKEPETYLVNPVDPSRERWLSLAGLIGRRWICLVLTGVAMLEIFGRSFAEFQQSRLSELDIQVRAAGRNQRAAKVIYGKVGALKNFESRKVPWAKILSGLQGLPREGLAWRRLVGAPGEVEPGAGDRRVPGITFVLDGANNGEIRNLETAVAFLQRKFPGSEVELKKIDSPTAGNAGARAEFSIVCRTGRELK
jgi:hypothetical protein